MLRRKRFYVIYPEYFDSNLSRSLGRRVAISLADTQPHLKKLVKACKDLNIDHEAQPEKSFPSRWWNNSGRLLIPINKGSKTPKQDLINQIGAQARRYKPKKKAVKQKVSKEKSSTKKTRKETKIRSARRSSRK